MRGYFECVVFVLIMSNRVHIGDYIFMSPDKTSPFVQVLEGISNLRTMPRAEAEELFKSLRSKGLQLKDSLQVRMNSSMGNVYTGPNW